VKAKQNPQLSTNISFVLSNFTLTDEIVLIIFNSLGWKRIEFVELPIANLVVRNANGQNLTSQTFQNGNSIFSATIPALGFSTFFISQKQQKEEKEKLEEKFIENKFFRIYLNEKTGQIESILLKKTNYSMAFNPHVNRKEKKKKMENKLLFIF
jgi:hypothetical protein